MDELIINQTKYISSKRASQQSGYARDYIGQLIRQGKLEAKRVGRAWYVSETSLARLTAEPQAVTSYTPAKFPVVPGTVEYAMPKTWSEIRYLPDERELYPISDSRVAPGVSEIANVSNAHAATTLPERVKITVIRPGKVSYMAPNSLSAGMMGVRMPTRTQIVAPELQQKRSIVLPAQRTVGVATGALVFLLLVPIFL